MEFSSPLPRGVKKIVLAYDGSSVAQEAAHEAADVAQRCQAEVIVLKVGRLMEPVDGLLLPTMEDETHHWIAESGAGLVRSLGATAEARFEWGDPAREIVKMAKLERASLIVMGHNSASWLRRLFSRGTDSKVLDVAPCPVLVVGSERQMRGMQQLGEDNPDGQDIVGR